jgi:hypothetical protein
MAEAIKCLPSKHKALSSNPSSTKKKKGRKGGREGGRKKKKSEVENTTEIKNFTIGVL